MRNYIMHLPDNLYAEGFAKIIEPFHDKTERKYIKPVYMDNSVTLQSEKNNFKKICEGGVMKGLEEYSAHTRFSQMFFKFSHIFMIFWYKKDFVTLHCF